MDPSAAFAQTYEQAREKFLAVADAADLDVESHIHPLRGRDGETLAMDVALDGPRDASRLLLVSSACHGVEGFCGSGIQVALLSDSDWRKRARDAGVAVLYIHGLNPYGFSWWRRVTQENVDLNRNFHDFGQPLPPNPQYDEIASLLAPPTWPPSDEINAKVAQLIAERGMAALQSATSGGQYDHPEGLFYGGHDPTWSNQTLRQVLRDNGRRCARLGWIDLHTGLGPRGHGERIFACRDDAAALARARVWWGEQVTSIYDGSSTSAMLTGLMWLAAYDECPQAEYTGIALEFGTVPILDVINALRAEQWLENHPEAPAAMARHIKQQLRDAFYVDEDDWKRMVVAQAQDCANAAILGLSS
ncbi:MAG TPA: M14 family metallopeptidase [Albitalea sp.]|uniref:M14 family metallopeptidase n=1 Tax=Piscinibacter sp. TaxID=1903157 RepID=UPI002ED6A7AC